MKKIIIILGLLVAGFSSQAQFPTTDSLVKFINRYIRNSAVEAFQNLRLNTAMIGMTRFIDSAYGGQVKSFAAVNDSTVRLITIGLDTFTVVIRGTGSTPTLQQVLTAGNDISGQDNTIMLGTKKLLFQGDQAQSVRIGKDVSDPGAYAMEIKSNEALGSVGVLKFTELNYPGSDLNLGLFSGGDGYLNFTATNGNTGQLGMTAGGASIIYNTLAGEMSINIAPVLNGMRVRDVPNLAGFFYDADYSANGISVFGDRWVTDWGWIKKTLTDSTGLQHVLNRGSSAVITPQFSIKVEDPGFQSSTLSVDKDFIDLESSDGSRFSNLSLLKTDPSFNHLDLSSGDEEKIILQTEGVKIRAIDGTTLTGRSMSLDHSRQWYLGDQEFGGSGNAGFLIDTDFRMRDTAYTNNVAKDSILRMTADGWMEQVHPKDMASMLSGGGSLNKLAYWTGTNTLGFNSGLTFGPGNGQQTNTGAFVAPSVTGTFILEAGTLGHIGFNLFSRITSQGDGFLRFANNAGGGFTMLQFGGGTSGSPALSVDGSSLRVRGGDNIADAGLFAASLTLSVGKLTVPATNTTGGTTGDQIINKASGTVNIAAAGTTVTVTNSFVTTSSIVFAVIRTADATAVIKNVVPGSGSFIINLNAAATSETSIGFFVIN